MCLPERGVNRRVPAPAANEVPGVIQGTYLVGAVSRQVESSHRTPNALDRRNISSRATAITRWSSSPVASVLLLSTRMTRMTMTLATKIPISAPTRARACHLAAALSAAAAALHQSLSRQPARPVPASATASRARGTESNWTAVAPAAATRIKSARPRVTGKSTRPVFAKPGATAWSSVDTKQSFHSRSLLDPSIFFSSRHALTLGFLRRFCHFWPHSLDFP